MMDMYELMPDPSVKLLHREPTHGAPISPMMKARLSGLRITLVAIDLNPSNTALDEAS